MRVTCPNCSAVYDAPDAALGLGGRRVECSACNHQWFQPGPELVHAEAGSSTMPGMAEAARGMAALSEPEPVPVALAPLAEPAPEAMPASRLRTGEAPRPARPGAPRPGETREELRQRRPAASINAERLSAELRAAEAQEEAGGGGGGYFAGFVLALILSGLLAFAYVGKDKVAEMVPGAAPYLEQYSQGVDRARLRVEAVAALAKEKIAELTQ